MYLLLISETLIDMQHDETLCKAVIKLISEKKLSLCER